MSLRRLASRNSRGAGPGTPVESPRTPRRSTAFVTSPLASPSLSETIPFDWEAARRAVPITPDHRRIPRTPRTSAVGTPSRKAIVKQPSLVSRVTSIPSQIAFQWSMFPHNIDLPHPKTTAFIVAGIMHFIHFCVRVHQISQVPDSDVGWEDMYHEGGGLSWFDWTVPMSFLLVLGSLLNTAYLFTRVKLYRLHHQADPVASPNARFVERDLDYERLEPSPMWKQVVSLLWRGFKISWRFLLGIAPPPESAAPTISLIQQLEVWTPGEFETTLFCVYSPAHCLMWMATNSSNWMMMFIVMGVVGVQIHTVSLSFRALLKDKEIIASQVMNEYNYKFVNPRVNPIRKDASVMTHQSEVVNVWED